MNFYQRKISGVLSKLGRVDIQPRHVEAFMRDSNGTLDRLSPRAFATAVDISVMYVDEVGEDAAEMLARSYGI